MTSRAIFGKPGTLIPHESDSEIVILGNDSIHLRFRSLSAAFPFRHKAQLNC